MAQFNYNVGGLNVDVPGIMMAREKKLAYEASRMRDQKAQERQEKLDLMDEQIRNLNEQFIVKHQADPNYQWEGSVERERISGLDPDMLMRMDTHFGGINKEDRNDRIRITAAHAYDTFLNLNSGFNDRALQDTRVRLQALRDNGVKDTKDTEELLGYLEKGEFEKAKELTKNAVGVFASQGYLDIANPAEYQYFAPVTSQETGTEQLIGRSAYDTKVVDTNVRGVTAEEKMRNELDQLTEEQKIRASADFKSKKLASLDESLTTFNNSARKAEQALSILDQGFETGIPQQVLFTAAKVLPSGVMDAIYNAPDQEAKAGLLKQALTQLTFDTLASFKGPTTDFELNYSENVAGRFTDPTRANRARLMSIKRAQELEKRRADFMADYLRNNENDPYKVESAWDSYYRGNNVDLGGGITTSLRKLQEDAAENGVSVNDWLAALRQ